MQAATNSPAPIAADALHAARKCVSDLATIQNILWHPDSGDLIRTAWLALHADRAARKAAEVQ